MPIEVRAARGQADRLTQLLPQHLDPDDPHPRNVAPGDRFVTINKLRGERSRRILAHEIQNALAGIARRFITGGLHLALGRRSCYNSFVEPQIPIDRERIVSFCRRWRVVESDTAE